MTKSDSYTAARATYGNPHVDIIVRNAIAATIERCAQVVEQMVECNYLAIAAAIRKLKDAPPVDPNIIHPGKDPDFTFPEEEP